MWLAMLACGLRAQTYKIESGKSVTIDLPGVTAAYSLDSTCAEAEAQNGVVTVTGKMHGATHVVAVTPAGTQTLEIVVADLAVKRARDIFNPLLMQTGTEFGSFSTRYDSTSNQVQSEMDLSRRQDQTTIRAHVVATRMFGALSSGESRTGLPAASYEISMPRRDITILDKYLEESPLAITGSIVRGVHYREGDWFLHAGYTSVASFEGLLLPARAEGVVEAGYRRPLTPHSSLSGTFYDFLVPASDRVGRSGTIGLLSYAYTPREGFRLNVETGWSRGAAASARLEYRGDRDNIRASIRYSPPTFASLGSNSMKGFHADLTWTRQLTGKLSSDVSFYDNKMVLPGIEQTTVNASAKIQYKLGSYWSIFGGGTGSTYETAVPPRPPVRSLSAPAGVGFNSRHFGAQGQYQFSKTTQQDAGGRQIRASINTGVGPLSLSAFGEEQTQAPTLSFILDQTPGLQQALNLLGVQATSIQAVNDILRDNSALFAAGYIRGASINLAPLRRQAGGSLNLMGHGPWPQVSYNFIYSDNAGLTSNNLTAIHTLVYTQRLGPENLSFSYSMIGTKSPGMAAIYKPMLSAGWRHEARSVPSFLIPERHGAISGVVFRDDDSKGAYEAGMPLMEGARVVLDERRRVDTSADGAFRFTGVRPGRHHLAVTYQSARPTFFSTQSEVDVAENATMNFGIGYSLSGLGGRLTNDAGSGIPGVTVNVRNPQQHWSASTDSDGSFFLRQLPEGEYEVAMDEESVPAGYLTAELEPQKVKVEASTPGRVEFHMKALRSIAGRVVTFDRATNKVIPVSRMQVRLKETAKISVTDALGQYVFRDLPAGQYTVAVTAGAKDVSRSVTLPVTPLAQSNIDLQLGDDALPSPVAPNDSKPPDVKPKDQPALPAAVKPAAEKAPQPAPTAPIPSPATSAASPHASPAAVKPAAEKAPQPAPTTAAPIRSGPAVVPSPAASASPAPSATAPIRSTPAAVPSPAASASPAPTGHAVEAPGIPENMERAGKLAADLEMLGRQKLNQGRYVDAIFDLSEALRVAPRSATAYNARGFAWFKLHQLRRALEDLDQALQLNPNYTNAYHNRAAVKRALGDLSGAQADRRREAGFM